MDTAPWEGAAGICWVGAAWRGAEAASTSVPQVVQYLVPLGSSVPQCGQFMGAS
jgi:hypothetical protein